MKINKGNTAKVISGKHKGQSGTIISLEKNKQRVIIEGVNIKIKHVKPKQQDEKGKIEKIEGPVHISNIKINIT